MNKPPSNNDVGKLDNALAGRYEFKIMPLLIQANASLKLTMAPMIIALLITLFTSVFTAIILLWVLNIDVEQPIPQPQGALLDVLVLLLLSPLMVGMKMLGARAAVGAPVALNQLFRYVSYFIPLAVANLLIMTLMQVGLVLLVLPAIYIHVATSFTLLLICDKQMGVFSAFVLSAKVVNRYLLQFLALIGVFALLMLLVVFTFGIAILWVGPLYYVTFGRLYADLFGIGLVPESTSNTQSDSLFNA